MMKLIVCPAKKTHKLAIRTQQIIAYETGATKSVDPSAVHTLSRK
jgi:methylmalonyl-CoA mutase N-terminal domain/subunit